MACILLKSRQLFKPESLKFNSAMNTRKLLALATAIVGLASSAFAQTQTIEATVARVTGKATATLPNGSTVDLTAGTKLPQGSTITTGADGDVYLETHKGYVSAIKKDSVVTVDEVSVVTEGGKVTQERTMLDLKSGNLVAQLDPKKKAVNNYQVRTPKGVAAARGTTFSVAYKGGTITVAVVGGVVRITGADGYRGTPASIDSRAESKEMIAGTYLRIAQTLEDAGNGGSSQRFADLASERQEQANDMKDLLATVVATVAIAAQQGLTDPATAATVAKAVFTAAPETASTAAAIIKNSGGDTSSSNEVIQAIRNEVPASQQSSFDNSATTGTSTETVVNTQTNTKETVTTTPEKIDTTTISRSNE